MGTHDLRFGIVGVGVCCFRINPLNACDWSSEQ